MNYKQKYLTETNTIHGDGIQKIYSFPNGYGASVVKHKGSYGFNDNKWELAVLKDGELCYSTDITSDVIGHLNDPQVDAILKQIELINVPQPLNYHGHTIVRDNA